MESQVGLMARLTAIRVNNSADPFGPMLELSNPLLGFQELDIVLCHSCIPILNHDSILIPHNIFTN